ncbi:MAG TPA: hypothetical protein VHV77_13850 [Pirellulales bacterium]|jgi:hypothetical protein|nr:hypothetical protein [Pirellulales bacterium]
MQHKRLRFRPGFHVALGDRRSQAPTAYTADGEELPRGRSIALALLWRSTARFRSLWARIAVIALQTGLGFVIYVMACLWYVVGTGVDSL